MNSVNIVLVTPVDDECFRRIITTNPQIKLTDASHLVPQFPAKPEPPDPAKEKALDALLAEAEIIYGFMPPRNVIARSPKLKWIQTLSAGVDRTLTPEIAASQVIMTNASGIHVVPISELVFAFILTFAKHLPQYFENQKLKKWEPYQSETLSGKTLGIIGLGNIGRRIAHLGKAYGMRVVGTRRHVREVCRARDCDVVYPREQLEQLLAESDYVVMSIPHTRETDKMIGEKELRTMKRTAFFVNIGRGKTVDEEALIRALREHWIAGAGLDTFQQEPLPPDNPLWDLPNAIVTPHMSGRTDDYMTKATDIFCNNLQRYLAGKRLINLVDKKLGY